MSKKDITRLREDFPNLEGTIRGLKKDGKTDGFIADNLTNQGYKCSTSTIVRLRRELGITESLKHSGNAFRGHKHSEETKQKLSELKISTRASRGVNNYFYGLREEDSPTWKGGITSEHDLFFGSSVWKNARKFILKKDNHACQMCGSEEKKLSIHHIIPLKMDWDKRLELINMVTLCNSCHKKTYSREGLYIDILEELTKNSWRTEPVSQKEFMQAIDPG